MELRSSNDTPVPVVGGFGGRSLDVVVGPSKLAMATTMKDNDMLKPMRSFWTEC